MTTITKKVVAAPLVLSLAIALSACDGILDVELPGSTPAEALDDPAYSELLVVSAQGEFESALATYLFNAGHIAGELIGGQSALGAIPFQRRDVRSLDTQGDGLYNGLSRARFMADDAYNRIDAFTDAEVPNRTRLLGRAALWAGYSYAYFAEGYCRLAFDRGPALTPTQGFELARDRFTTAIQMAQQAGDTETLNTAYVGRARVLLSLGQTAAAATDARLVPAGFTRTVSRSSATTSQGQLPRRNVIFFDNVTSKAVSIDPKYWNTTWQTVADPRVRLTDTGTITADGITPLYLQTKYTTESTPIRFASYTEAQLIIAEAEGGQNAVAIINALHTAAGIPPFASTDETVIKNQVVEERRREFFLEGRRLGDLRKYGGFPESTHGFNPFIGYEYGKTECFPLPDSEVNNNPNLDP